MSRLLSPTADPRRPSPARQARCRVDRPRIVFLWRAVTFIGAKIAFIRRAVAFMRRVVACICRVVAFIRRVVACICRVVAYIRRAVACIGGVVALIRRAVAFFRRAVAFIRRKTRSATMLSCSTGVLSRLSSERRVYPRRIVFECHRKETRCPPRTPLLPFAAVFRQAGERAGKIHLPLASFVADSNLRPPVRR
jgi:hypothetical protein